MPSKTVETAVGGWASWGLMVGAARVSITGPFTRCWVFLHSFRRGGGVLLVPTLVHATRGRQINFARALACELWPSGGLESVRQLDGMTPCATTAVTGDCSAASMNHIISVIVHSSCGARKIT
eukprot:3104759-Prymnesium_polylepis.3